MPAYFVVRCTYKDMEDYDSYARYAGIAVNKCNGNFLVKGNEEHYQKEKGTHVKTVVVEFNSILDAKSCYQSNEYQKAINYIHNSSSRDFIIIDGL
ncbi:MAG: DUF1330 domain-containing protein [Gammaproteobacteria bacterium]|nr:DUF1330 domain-containing protein [Gammaproteobacteria bacterium]